MASFGDRIVVLIDMDCFYCQVEAKLQPEYKGKPLAVVQYNQWRLGGIIAVNYEARDFGVTRHMRGDEAKAKCPDIVLAIVPSLRGKADTSKYRAAGRSVIEVLKCHCSKIERASVDEAYLDITQLVEERMLHISNVNNDLAQKLNNTYVVGYSETGINDEDKRKTGMQEWLQRSNEVNDIQAKRLAIGGLIVEEIRADIFEKTEYKCSAGISYNKILAKLACGLHKPNKQTILPYSAVPSLFSTLPVKNVRNLGGKLGDIVIESLKCNVMADLLQYSLQHLQNRFDEKTGLWLYNIARGIEHEPVTTRLVSKSIGACKQFPGKQALTNIEMLKHWLGELAAEICERLEQDNEENERRATLLTFSYHYQQNNSIVSQSRSLPLNSYKQEKMQNQCYELIIKIQHPITFLGLSAGKFVRAKGNENIGNFFKNDKSDILHKSNNDKINTKDTRSETVQKIEKDSEVKKINKKFDNHAQNSNKEINSFFKSLIEETKIVDIKDEIVKETKYNSQLKETEKTDSCNDIHSTSSKGLHSFFKTINGVQTPKTKTKSTNEKNDAIRNSDNLKKSFFVNMLKEEKIDDNKSECNISNSESCSTNTAFKEDYVAVKLQDIFPDLDNIDPNVLACLPQQLQREANMLMKNQKHQKSEKVSPKIGRPKSGKIKLAKRKMSEENSINRFFIKTGNTNKIGDNFHKCDQCGQLVSIEKIYEHQDYHLAQHLQKVVNKSELNLEDNNKRKRSSSECSPQKKSAESNVENTKKRTLTSFFM